MSKSDDALCLCACLAVFLCVAVEAAAVGERFGFCGSKADRSLAAFASLARWRCLLLSTSKACSVWHLGVEKKLPISLEYNVFQDELLCLCMQYSSFPP